MPVNQPFIITSPDLVPPGRDWWFMDPTVGPVLNSGIVSTVFFGWEVRQFNRRLLEIQEEYLVPYQKILQKNMGRRFTLYDIERITRIFLNRGIIDYRKYYGATQILKVMGTNHKLI